MLQIFRHAHLPHELVLVPVHAGQRADVCKDVLQRVRELERVDVAESELHVRVDDELRQPEDLTAQMEGVSETGLLTLLRGERPTYTDQYNAETERHLTYLTGFKFML